MEPSQLTNILAIWGAVTGSIGTLIGFFTLSLRIKAHKKDQPKLICSSDFSFEHSSGFDPREMHKIVIRSVGKRPVTIDYVRYCINPPTFWYRLIKSQMWKKGRWVYDDSPRDPISLTEGKKNNFKIKLPNGLNYRDILKVEVHDQGGRKWSVDWPQRSRVEKLTQYNKLHESEVKEANLFCKVTGYLAGETHHLHVSWRSKQMPPNQSRNRFFHFDSEKKYSDKLAEITSLLAPQVLKGELEEIK